MNCGKVHLNGIKDTSENNLYLVAYMFKLKIGYIIVYIISCEWMCVQWSSF